MTSQFKLLVNEKTSTATVEKYSLSILIVDRLNLSYINDSDWSKAGYYILFSQKDGKQKYTAYTGKSDKNILTRLKAHDSNKDFWTKAILVKRSNEHGFSPSQVSWFEWKLNGLLEENPYINKDNIQKVDKPGGLDQDSDDEYNDLLSPILDLCKLIGYNLESSNLQQSSKSVNKAALVNSQTSKAVALESNKKKQFKSTVLDLVSLGIVPAGTVVYSTEKGYPGEAIILDNGNIDYNDVEYTSPSSAGLACRQAVKPSFENQPNGWKFWAVKQADGSFKFLGDYRPN